MLRKDSLPLGLLIGLLIPFIGYALLLEIYDQLESNLLISDFGMTTNFRDRTIALLAVCFNLIPFMYYNNHRCYNTMRGLVFPTVILAVAWFFYFQENLLG